MKRKATELGTRPHLMWAQNACICTEKELHDRSGLIGCFIMDGRCLNIGKSGIWVRKVVGRLDDFPSKVIDNKRVRLILSTDKAHEPKLGCLMDYKLALCPPSIVFIV